MPCRRIANAWSSAPRDLRRTPCFSISKTLSPWAKKNAALRTAIDAITRLDWGQKTVTVRINAIDSPSIAEEVEKLSGLARLDAVLLPKAERVADVIGIGQRLSQHRGDRNHPLELELLIETALGVVNVDPLAAAHATVAALHFGVGDFSASIGARSDEIGLSPATTGTSPPQRRSTGKQRSTSSPIR